MACCHHYELMEGGDNAFTVDASTLTFGEGALGEAGERAKAMGMRRAALFTDSRLVGMEPAATVKASLQEAGIEVVVYDEVHIEPTDESFKAAAAFAREAKPDGYVSVGGGSVMDTCKAANLYASHPAEFMTYVNSPVGDGQPVPGAIAPHIACPTTSGTGSECTGIAVFDLLGMKAKTGIASRHLRPTQALVDPAVTVTLPATVVAASGFDVLSHALESFTAKPYTRRAAPGSPGLRPMSQGANPWSDIGSREAMRLVGKYLVRAVRDENDREARVQMIWAATLAGIAFGNAGVHAPHGMSYGVAGLVREFRPASGYPTEEAMVPHGMSVIVNSPAVFRRFAEIDPERHLEGARLLGADIRGAEAADAGQVLSEHIIGMMRATEMPNGIGGVGYGSEDIGALAEGSYAQQRLLKNAPVAVTKELLKELFDDALTYW